MNDNGRSYAREKFYSAVLGMAVSPGTIQERLRDAYVYNIMHVNRQAIPEGRLFDFDQLKEELTRHEAEGSEGRVGASVGCMTDDQAITLAQKVFSIFMDLRDG